MDSKHSHCWEGEEVPATDYEGPAGDAVGKPGKFSVVSDVQICQQLLATLKFFPPCLLTPRFIAVFRDVLPLSADKLRLTKHLLSCIPRNSHLLRLADNRNLLSLFFAHRRLLIYHQ